MATAAPHVKLLRQLASAKDDYLSGAFDISWDGAKATLYLVFGRPSHAVFDTDQAQIEGEAAIDALLAELPRTFAVSDWRRAMSPHETLSISIDELAGPFVRLAGSYADDPVSEEEPEWWSSNDSSPDLAFGLSDFPLLPGGRPLWAETSPENVNLAERLAELPPSILILTGAKLRAAAVVSGGDLIDAVWIDDEDQARGEAAGMAMLGATKGTLAGYALDDPRVAEALTMLWRLPLAVSGIDMSWLDPASMLAAFRADGLDRVLVIDAPVRGIALFSRGGLVAVYSETQRSAVASPERLRSLLSQAHGRLTVMERKPRPVAAGAGNAAPSATDFFGVVTPETPAEVPADVEPATTETAETQPQVDGAVAEGEPADSAPGETTTDPAADVSAETSTAPGDAGAFQAEADAATEPVAQSPADADAENISSSPSTIADSEPTSEPTAHTDADATPDQEFGTLGATTDVSDEADTNAHGTEPPPPPPPDAEHAPPLEGADIAASVEHTPPPPAPDLAAEPERKAKRWWAFGSRKNKAAANPASTPETIAAEAAAAHEAVDAASFAGWSVRQPNPEPLPVWQRSRDTGEGADDVRAGTAPPPVDDAAADGSAEAPDAEGGPPAPVATWSIVEPGTLGARTASTPSEPPADHAGEAEAEAPAGAEAPAEAEAKPETAAAQGWSARDVIADSVGWYQAADASQPDAAPGADAEDASAAPAEGEHQEIAASAHEDTGEADHDGAAAADDATTAWYHPEPVATDDHEQVAADEHDTSDAADHPATDWYHPQATAASGHEPAGTSDPDPDAAPDVEPADVTNHEPSTAAEPTHDFWAEFASPDPDAADADTPAESEPDAAPAAQSEDESVEEPAATDHAEPFARRPSERTQAPWSWPLAESEPTPATGAHASAAVPVDETPEPATTSAHDTSESEDWAPVFEGAGGDQSFFQRDEPVGSQFVDFDEVRTELVQIGVVWLGEANAVPVTALLRKTRSTIDDFVATIDTIRGLHLEGQDPASIQAMAREMHQQAAERLCGA